MQGGQGCGEGAVLVQLLGAAGTHDQQWPLWVEAQQVVEPLQRLAAAPLQVIDDQDLGLAGAKHSLGKGLKEALATPGFNHGPGRW